MPISLEGLLRYICCPTQRLCPPRKQALCVTTTPTHLSTLVLVRCSHHLPAALCLLTGLTLSNHAMCVQVGVFLERMVGVGVHIRRSRTSQFLTSSLRR